MRWDNPFYDNHLFTEWDCQRRPMRWWQYPWLWFYPTYVQINDGYVWHYKVVGGAYYLMKYEEFQK